MVEEQCRFFFGGERLLVPTGKIEKHVLKEVLAKSVGDTARFLQFLEMQTIFLEKVPHYLHGGVHSHERRKL